MVVLAPTGDRAIGSQPAEVIPSGTDIGKPAIQEHGLEVILIAPAGDRAACPQGTGVAAFPPSGLPAVRAGRTDDAPPLDAVPGGDLLLAVEAVRPVLVVLVEVLSHQLQAVGAAGHQGRVVGVVRGHAL